MSLARSGGSDHTKLAVSPSAPPKGSSAIAMMSDALKRLDEVLNDLERALAAR